MENREVILTGCGNRTRVEAGRGDIQICESRAGNLQGLIQFLDVSGLEVLKVNETQ